MQKITLNHKEALIVDVPDKFPLQKRKTGAGD